MAGNKLIYAKECYRIMGIIFDVFNELGYGHKETVYQKAIAKEFKDRKIDYKEQLKCRIKYKNEEVGFYVLDFLVFDKIVVELKQKDFLSHKDIEQIYKYLKATKLSLGLIVTFTSKGVRYKRIVNIK